MTESPIKVMILEDEEGLADAMVKYLKLKQFDAFYSLNGRDAIEKFQQESPDICLLDIQLGYSQLDGLQVLEKIKEIDPSAECIIVTRITDEKSIEKAKKLDAIFDFLI